MTRPGNKYAYRQCVKTGKRRYYDEIAAKLHLSTIELRDNSHYKPVRAYRCEFCKGWHTTSSPKRVHDQNTAVDPE